VQLADPTDEGGLMPVEKQKVQHKWEQFARSCDRSRVEANSVPMLLIEKRVAGEGSRYPFIGTMDDMSKIDLIVQKALLDMTSDKPAPSLVFEPEELAFITKVINEFFFLNPQHEADDEFVAEDIIQKIALQME
jgi:hypothetical protein